MTWRQSQDSKPHLSSHPIPPVPRLPERTTPGEPRQRSQAKSESPAPFPGAARTPKALSAPKRGSGQRDPRPDRGARAEGGSGELPLRGRLTFQRQARRARGTRSSGLRLRSLNFLVARRRPSAGQANCNKRRPGSATGEEALVPLLLSRSRGRRAPRVRPGPRGSRWQIRWAAAAPPQPVPLKLQLPSPHPVPALPPIPPATAHSQTPRYPQPDLLAFFVIKMKTDPVPTPCTPSACQSHHCHLPSPALLLQSLTDCANPDQAPRTALGLKWFLEIFLSDFFRWSPIGDLLSDRLSHLSR